MIRLVVDRMCFGLTVDCRFGFNTGCLGVLGLLCDLFGMVWQLVNMHWLGGG